MPRDLIDALVDRGAVTMACRVHARLHRLFRWAAQRRLIASNPMRDMPRPPGGEVRRKRALKDDELRCGSAPAKPAGRWGRPCSFWSSHAPERWKSAALRWAEIDRNHILLKGERTKNGEDRIIPLSTMTRELLDAVPRLAGSPFVFSTTGTTPPSGWSNVKERIDAQMRAELAKSGKELEPWRLHDIRRTAATGLERLGVPLQVTEALLGHTAGSKGGIVGVYQLHSYEKEKREALKKWAAHVASLVGGKNGA